MATSEIRGNVVFVNQCSFTEIPQVPNNAFGNQHFKTGDPLAGEKAVHRHALRHGIADGTTVASQTQVLFTARAAATLVSVKARCTTAPDGGDRQFTIDVQKAADGSASWSTLLSAVITFADADSDDDTKSATLIGSPNLAADESLRVVITASGSSGTQGAGASVTIELDEQPS